MVKLQDGDVDEDNERPVYPHKILRTNVITNPFPDIQPRATIQLLTCLLYTSDAADE